MPPQSAVASASEMGRFETDWLMRPQNIAALGDLSGQRIDSVHRRRPPQVIVLDIDSSESPTKTTSFADGRRLEWMPKKSSGQSA
jgi:hypothetical protein